MHSSDLAPSPYRAAPPLRMSGRSILQTTLGLLAVGGVALFLLGRQLPAPSPEVGGGAPTGLGQLPTGLPPQPATSSLPNVQRRDAIVSVVEAVAPSVVSISTEQVVRSPFSNLQFFGDYFDRLEPRDRLQQASLGSGVVIDQEGHILTNEHVIRGAAKVTAMLSDDRQADCEVVGADAENDLAVLRMVQKLNVPPAKLGTSKDLMIGETVIAIGSPFGLSHTVTTGVVSAVNRSFKADNKVYRDFIQTDAAINPGNSGGPLLNILGEVIGINTAIFGSGQGLGFAIPADKAKRVLDDLIRYGQRPEGWVGAEVREDEKEIVGRSTSRGQIPAVKVVWLQKGGPAEKAGLKLGDRLVSIDKTRVEGEDDFRAAVRQIGVGDELVLNVMRSGQNQAQEVKIRTTAIPLEVADEIIANRLGIKVQANSAALAQQYRLPASEGLVLMEVSRDGIFGRLGAQPGDVIRKVNGQLTNTEAELRTAIMRGWGRKSAIFLIQRGRIVYTVPIQM